MLNIKPTQTDKKIITPNSSSSRNSARNMKVPSASPFYSGMQCV